MGWDTLLALLWRHAHAKRTEDALWSWQQTCDEQERELAALRGVRDHAQQMLDSFDRRPTDGCVRDGLGLAESLRRYREMRDGTRLPSAPKGQQGVLPRSSGQRRGFDVSADAAVPDVHDDPSWGPESAARFGR